MKKQIFLVIIVMICGIFLSSCMFDKNENIECQHEFSEWTISVLPSCSTEGVELRSCSKCNETEEQPIPKTEEHTVIIDSAVAATCETEGLTEGSHCSQCNEILVPQNTIAILGHVEVVEAAILPTCVKPGITEGRHCSVCNKILVKQEKIKELGHTEVIDKVKAATCIETGLTEGKHCSVCNETLVKQNIIPALGHIEVIDKVKAATCTETGLTEGNHCSVCNEILVKQNVIQALGHIEVIEKLKTATCTETGLTEGKYCSVCNETLVKQNVTPALGHIEVIDKAKTATCTETGLTEGKYCSVCNETLVKQNVIAALGHTEVIDNEIAATCTKNGLTEGSHCSVCLVVLIDQKVINAFGHKEVYDAPQNATCTKTGLTAGRHCLTCGEVLVEQILINALGHNYNVRDICYVCYAPKGIEITVTEFSSPQYIVCDTVVEYMKSPSDSIITSMPSFNTETFKDIGRAVTIEYNLSGYNAFRIYVLDAKLVVSKNEDLSDGICFEHYGIENSFEVYNLEVGEQYYFEITVRMTNGSRLSERGEFETADVPRILKIDGMNNVRDIGGWKTEDGRRVKQGMLYRGVEMDGKVAFYHNLTTEGYIVMTELLGIRYDMDLRDPRVVGNSLSPLGVDVRYYNCVQYEDIFTANGKQKIKAIFKDLADKSNYPIYLHCTFGSDRTGTVAFLLEGLLGVSMEDAIRDYELSALCYSSKTRDIYLGIMLAELEKYSGSTFKEKVESYLTDAGVTLSQMESIRSIFLD